LARNDTLDAHTFSIVGSSSSPTSKPINHAKGSDGVSSSEKQDHGCRTVAIGEKGLKKEISSWLEIEEGDDL
jgi:hypothetical protein